MNLQKHNQVKSKLTLFDIKTAWTIWIGTNVHIIYLFVYLETTLKMLLNP